MWRYYASGANDWSAQPLSENPLVGPSSQTLVSMGAQVTNLTKDGQWWRLLTAMFLHAGVYVAEPSPPLSIFIYIYM